MKKLTLALLCCLALLNLQAQTALVAGDIAFTGVNSTSNTANDFVNTPQSESNREFCFILLKQVTAGTTIFFTDFGWRTDAQAFQTANPCGANSGALTDGVVRWQANSTLPYGTQIVVRCVTNPKANVGTATGTQATFNSATEYVTLATAGEAVFAFTGTLAAPTLISAVCARPTGWIGILNNCDFTATPSALPNILNNALNGNSNYSFAVLPANGSGYCMRLRPTVRISTDPAAARATIYNAANWEATSSNAAYTLPASTGNIALPVTFGGITAVVKNKLLSVKWHTSSETNCKGYAVEASADGTDWISIGTAASKAANGNSSTFLHYKLDFDLQQIALSFACLATLLLIANQRRKLFMLLIMVTAAITLAACTKSGHQQSLTMASKIFIRIAQHDIDGSTHYSKVIQAVKE